VSTLICLNSDRQQARRYIAPDDGPTFLLDFFAPEFAQAIFVPNS